MQTINLQRTDAVDNKYLLSIVNSVYLDKADAIVGVPKIDNFGNILFRFRDDRQLYDAKITPQNQLTYVEATSRKDAYFEGYYLDNGIFPFVPPGYVDGILSTIIRTDAKRRRCKRGKPCGDACIEKGDVCDRPIPQKALFSTNKLRDNLNNKNKSGAGPAALGLGVFGVAAIGGGAAILASRGSGGGSSGGTAVSNKPSSKTVELVVPISNTQPNSLPEPTQVERQEPPAPPPVQRLFPALPFSKRTRSNPSTIEVFETSRNATPEETIRFKPGREPTRTSGELPSSGVTTVPNPKSKTRAERGLPTAGSPGLVALNEFSDDRPEDKARIAKQGGVVPSSGGLIKSAKISGFDQESAAKLQNVLTRIDKVFPKLPELPPVTIEPMPKTDSMYDKAEAAYYQSHYVDKDTNEVIDRIPTRIKLNVSGQQGNHTELALVHEVGHLLDHAAVGKTKDWYGTTPLIGGKYEKPHPAFDEFFKVVQTTPTTKKALDRWRSKDEKDPEFKQYLEYSLQNREVFARAFGQYVVAKSDSGVLKAQFKRDQKVEKDRYWKDAEFKTLEPVMDKMFKELGWN